MSQSKALANVFKLNDIFDVTEPRFGAKGDGSTDDTAAFTAWAAAIVAAGGGVGVIPARTYNVTVPKNSQVCSFTSLKGFTLLAGGAVIADQQTYSGSETGILFKFASCKNFNVSRPKITAQDVGTATRGTRAFELVTGCEGFHIDAEIEGGLEGVEMVRAFNDPVADRCRHYTLKLKCTSTHYPVVGAFSGDDGVIQLDSTDGIRDFFFYGASHVDLRVRAKNPAGTSLITSFSGYGCDNFKLDYYDRDSTAHIDLPRVQVSWADQTAATHRDLDLHFDVAAVAGSAGVPFLCFGKYDNAGSPDTTGRGHRLEGFTLSYRSTQITGANHIGILDASVFSSSGTPDVVKNMRVRDSIGTGASVSDDWSFITPVLLDVFVFDHVHYDSPLVCNNTTHGRVAFKDCTATAFVSGNYGSLTYGDTGAVKVLLSTQTAATSASLDLVGFSNDFSEYELVVSNIVPTNDNTALYFRVSQSGSFVSGASDYRYARQAVTDGAVASQFGSTGEAQIGIAPTLGSSTGENFSCVIRIFVPTDTTKYKQISWIATMYSATPSVIFVEGAGSFVKNADPIDKVQVLMSAATIASGTATLYGIRKS